MKGQFPHWGKILNSGANFSACTVGTRVNGDFTGWLRAVISQGFYKNLLQVR